MNFLKKIVLKKNFPKKFKVHKFILGSCSEFFEEKFVKHKKSKNCPGNPDLKVICNNCQKLFKSNTQLNSHLHKK